ncbi:uncharacterized protein LOC127725291 [Mytilus californianus]|uniref:uncharacterized protein LOC127725291 n=1 Tax=Mytilus californianus TaxID=6549 RepID=UPI002246C4EF|nr:uncharacterized protein LOC127725291 [Mytilus californianus]
MMMLITVYLLSVGYVRTILGLTCFACSGLHDPWYCNTVEHCYEGQTCGMTKFVTKSGEANFHLGCVNSTNCQSRQPRSDIHSYCHSCCTSDVCNKNGCGHNGIPINQVGPICYQCTAIPNHADCKTVTLCRANEICFIYSFGRYTKVYMSGCRTRLSCQKYSGFNNIIGRRRNETRSKQECNRCCETNLCNSNCTDNN